MNRLLLVMLVAGALSSRAQTLYVPSGTAGIGSSTNGNVGIGTASPSNTQSWDRVLNIDGTENSKMIASSSGQNFRTGVYSHSTMNGGGGFIGTETNHKLFFMTNYTAQATLDVNGYLGIGTTTPSNHLEVSSNTFNRVSAIVTADVQTGFQALKQGANATSWELYVPTGSKDFRFFNAGLGDILSLTTNGTVGIGTSSPGAKLHISGTGNVEPIIEATDNSNASIFLKANGKTWQWSKRTTAESDMMQLNFHNGAAWQSSAIAVLTSGKVGIGTTSPDYPLTVNGSVHAKEVRVDLSVPGPDYVFEKDYKLTSLEDIKNYIDQNKHLPEVPSAKEMEKNGVQLGEMNMILLKKIEELTLHAIEQNKMIQEMRLENKVMKKENLEMRKELNDLKTKK